MYGIAFDLGTTQIAAYLCDLEKGNITDTVSCQNPQIECGLDVLSRVSYRNASADNAQRLSSLLGDRIVKITADFSEEYGEAERILLVGNPIIMGSIADYPFNEHPKVIRIPGIAHYVGADALSGAALLQKDRKNKNVILVDIGTNTEIVLLSDQKNVATSAAAGPAMEGGNLSCGMRGEEGAIASARLTNGVSNNSDIIFNVIGDVEPKGICGSGYFSLLECMKAAGVINNDGYLLSKDEALRENLPHRIVSRLDTDNTSDKNKNEDRIFRLTGPITISQEDIRNLQLAISAIRTGVEIVINESGLTEGVIDSVYLAGAFGNKITQESITAVGMLPEKLNDKVVQAGNLAGIGACHMLMNEASITDAISLKNSVLTVSLANHKDFRDLFVKNLSFNA
ncbi:MAG: ASKHA domain-containing protein [Lachnospiraceae bacterium]|nr:ASKHA domain-containing protein [Lachnospiraceae bacterium]